MQPSLQRNQGVLCDDLDVVVVVVVVWYMDGSRRLDCYTSLR